MKLSNLSKSNTLLETICDFLNYECGLKVTEAIIDEVLKYIKKNYFLDQLPYNDLINYLKKNLINSVLINETYFLRNPEQLDTIIDYYNKFLKNKKIKILSFGCSSGEECYSLAIKFFLENIDNYEIVGIDIDNEALEIAKKGEYTENSFRNNVMLLKNFFKRINDKYVIKDIYRKNITFLNINLLKENALKYFDKHHFDVILINNVLIYLDEKAISIILNQLNNLLSKQGILLTTKEEYFLIEKAHIFKKDPLNDFIYKKILFEDILQKEFRELYDIKAENDEQDANKIYEISNKYKNEPIEKLREYIKITQNKNEILAISYRIFEKTLNAEDLKNFINLLINENYYHEAHKWLKTYLMIINPTEKDLNDYIKLCIKTKNYDDLIPILKKKIELYNNKKDILLLKTILGHINEQ